MNQNVTGAGYAGAVPPPTLEFRSAAEKAASILDTAQRIENILGNLTQWADPAADQSSPHDPGLGHILDQAEQSLQRAYAMADHLRERIGTHI